MERGVCKLCQKEKMLCDSHLAPARLYRYCAAGGIGPVRFTEKEVTAGNRETTAYVLCQECETLLNREGENWLLPKLATVDKTFPFYDIVVSGRPDTSEDGMSAYAASKNPKIGFRKLTNFAIGVFWKASVHSWGLTDLPRMINLGAYQEPLRAFLAERKPFPEKATLVVGILTPDKAPVAFNFPILRSKTPFHEYVFYIPGILFILSVGRQIRAEQKQNCFFSNPLHPMIVGDLSSDVFGFLRRSSKNAKPSPEVAAYLAKRRAST